MALNPLDRIARDVEDVKRQLAGRSQLNHSSLENTAIPVYDDEGQERLRIGAQDDGTHSIKYVQGPPPPRPTTPSVSVDGPVVRVRWDGILMGGHIPEDFARIDVHFALASEDIEDASVVRANLATAAGSEATLMATQTGTYRVGLVAMSQSRARSEMSDTVEVEVQVVDLVSAIETAAESANGKNTVTYSQRSPEPSDEGAEGDTWWVNEARPRDPDDPAAGVVIAITEQWQHTGGVWVQVEMAHEVIASVDLGRATVGYLHGERVEAGTIDTPQLAFGAATGDVLSADALNFKTAQGLTIRSGAFYAGDAVEITEEHGIRQFGPDGALNVDLPSDGSESQFRGDLSARTLTATGSMSVQGHGAVAAGGDLELESGIAPPIAGPQITNRWDYYELPALGAGDRAQVGLGRADGLWWRWVEHTDAGADRGRLEGIDDNMEIVVSVGTGNRLGRDGVAAHAGNVYLLGPRTGDNSRRWVYTYTTAGVFVREWEFTDYQPGGYTPGIGVFPTGTPLYIAQRGATGTTRVGGYYPTSGAKFGAEYTVSGFSGDVGGIYWGNGDFGERRPVIVRKQSGGGRHQFLAYDEGSTLTPRSDLSWFAPHFQATSGLVYDAGQFHTLGSDGRVYRFLSLAPNRFVGDDEGDWWLAVSWRNPGPPLQQTPIGPATRFRFIRRANIHRQNGDVPAGVEQAGVYVAKSATPPAREDFRMTGTNTSPHHVNNMNGLPADWGTRGLPPETNTFTTDAPGEIRSAIGNFRVDGTGAGEWGALTFNPDGTVDGIPKVATGVVSIPTSTGPNGGKSSVVVTFPPGRFSAPPVVISITENGRLVPSIEAGTHTSSSVQLNVFNWTPNTAAAGVTLRWVAIEEPS